MLYHKQKFCKKSCYQSYLLNQLFSISELSRQIFTNSSSELYLSPFAAIVIKERNTISCSWNIASVWSVLPVRPSRSSCRRFGNESRSAMAERSVFHAAFLRSWRQPVSILAGPRTRAFASDSRRHSSRRLPDEFHFCPRKTNETRFLEIRATTAMRTLYFRPDKGNREPSIRLRFCFFNFSALRNFLRYSVMLSYSV